MCLVSLTDHWPAFIVSSALYQELDPFYSPKLRGQSIMLIHSEYEQLYTASPTHPPEPFDALLESVPVDENETDPVIRENTPDSSQDCVVLKDEKVSLADKPLDSDNFQLSSCVSGSDDSQSSPYIDEESLSDPRRAGNIPRPHKNELTYSSDNYTVSAIGPVGEGDNDSCSSENSSSSSKRLFLSQTCKTLSSGYVEDSFGVCGPFVFQSAAKWEEMEDERERGEKGARGEVEDQDGSKISDLTGGYVFSGIENEQESLSNSGQVHIFTTGGGDITECTNVDDESSVDPNYIHDSLYHAHITQSDHPHISL